jgi:caffeoyl-CoA O-methyltransferase
MSFVVPPEIEDYAEAHTTPHSELLGRLAEETRETLRSPQMLTGPVEGRLLEFLVFAIGAHRVLELGTYSGYSAISMAAALPAGGHIHTCEVDEEHAAVARRYIEEAGYADRITVHLGPALDTIDRLDGEFDFAFIDADKTEYLAYYEALVPRISERGLLAVDNTLWSGRVVDPDDSDEIRAILQLNERAASDPRVIAVQLTVRDGILLLRRA